MNENDLIKKAEELDRTLDLQLKQLKKDSEVWLKAGGAIVAIGLVAYGLKKAKRNKKSAQRPALDEVEQQVTRERRKKKRAKPSKKSSFFSTIKNRLFLMLLSYGEVKLVEELNKRIKRNE